MVNNKKTRLIITIMCFAFALWGFIFFSSSDFFKHSGSPNASLENAALKDLKNEQGLRIKSDTVEALTEVSAQISLEENVNTADTEKKLMQTINQHFNQVEKNDALRFQAEKLEQEVKRKIQSLNNK